MMIDQWDVVTTNLTHIDRLKGGIIHRPFPEYPEYHTIVPQHNKHHSDMTSGVHEVFGFGAATARDCAQSLRHRANKSSKFRLDWLSPLADVYFPQHVRDEIMGFCRPCYNSSALNRGDIELGVNAAKKMEIV